MITRSRVLVVGITYRTIQNYELGLLRLEKDGWQVKTLFFPSLSDPNSAYLDKISFECLGRHPINYQHYVNHKSLELTETLLERILFQALVEYDPDIILLTTCHMYPENKFKSLLNKHRKNRPLLVGCQHGFFQLWSVYEYQFNFDWFFCIGQAHRDHFSSGNSARTLPIGLPKFDEIKPWSGNRDGYILFAPQLSPPLEEIEVGIISFARSMNRRVIYRPHPEHQEVYKKFAMYEDVEEVATDQPLYPMLNECSVVISTSSTVVIEAMLCGCPVVVLPETGCVEYTASGVVATGYSVNEILEIFEKQLKDLTFYRNYLYKAVAGRPGEFSDQFVGAMRQVLVNTKVE